MLLQVYKHDGEVAKCGKKKHVCHTRRERHEKKVCVLRLGSTYENGADTSGRIY